MRTATPEHSIALELSRIFFVKKNMESDLRFECSHDAVRIANRLLDHPETLPDIDRPNQLLRSSEIGPIEDGGPAVKCRPQTPLPAEREPLGALGAAGRGGGWSEVST